MPDQNCPIAGYWGEETNTHLLTPSCQGAGESEKVSPQSPLLQTEQPQLLQLLLMGLLLQPPPQRRSSKPCTANTVCLKNPPRLHDAKQKQVLSKDGSCSPHKGT